MGKTHKGAVWLDPELTTPYDYYQYWINQDDADIERFLALFTFLPMDEIRDLGALPGEEIRRAKESLAYEATRICHGKEDMLPTNYLVGILQNLANPFLVIALIKRTLKRESPHTSYLKKPISVRPGLKHVVSFHREVGM